MAHFCSVVLFPPSWPLLCECWQLAIAVPHATGLTAVPIPDNYPYHHHSHHLSGRKKINTKDMHFVSQTVHRENNFLAHYSGQLTRHQHNKTFHQISKRLKGFFFFPILGLEPRALHVPGKWSTN
jgi:hypothetical protein